MPAPALEAELPAIAEALGLWGFGLMASGAGLVDSGLVDSDCWISSAVAAAQSALSGPYRPGPSFAVSAVAAS